MPLYILAPMVVVGLALVIGAAWISDRKKRHRPLDAGEYRARFLRDFPNEEIIGLEVSDDRWSAVLNLAGKNRIGVVFQMGQNQSTRLLVPEMISHVRQTDEGIDLELNDFSAHSLHLGFQESDRLATVTGWFDKLELK